LSKSAGLLLSRVVEGGRDITAKAIVFELVRCHWSDEQIATLFRRHFAGWDAWTDGEAALATKIADSRRWLKSERAKELGVDAGELGFEGS